MPEILIASLSPTGHISPLLTAAQGLVDRGDRVTVLTAAQHARKIRAIGATPVAIPPEADFDMTRLDIDLPGRTDTSGIKRVNFDIVRIFLQPMPLQTHALSELMAQTRFDAVLFDSGFFGTLPFLLGDPAARPPMLSYSTMPLMLSSRDTAPFGMGLAPSSTMLGRLRNRALTALSQQVLLRETQNVANHLLDRMNSRQLPTFVLDSGKLADRYIAPTVPEFDYPRRDLPANVRYVGAVHPGPSRGFRRPPWWSQLDGDRPVVHVTQGTIDNADLGRLIEPTIEALGGEDVVVVATTGGRDVSQLKVPLPANTYVAEYIPHDLLLSKVDVMVTNGGYGAVQRALSMGVPLVVAGNTEDKPEVAARVGWTGAGINLKTGTPRPGAIRGAVRKVLADGRYLRCARNLEMAFARRDGVAEIAALIDEVIAEREAVKA
ncbi:glycosyl transferase [Mycolicibacterium moriokaense]|jgi:MGT family glycosyltransferase|uniref:Glycosyl transferase n=1 Tax=Mycolicibacterium moriokaense TaxID=39691 RepID=A0AAD1H9Z3_9MYCO|nr:nucleotide disphospho-sugar-binding domain-containing protein [Mycolicibacterium moriokaense]MCV7039920.1 glycosyltransferase [Mycolicibacterium moriokaense]ORB25757.1 glycosyl transferase [Mycolicibacterium moriokaense]BBX01627.1 glycosyl transferase [Mycolicibacterium moriokaense]